MIKLYRITLKTYIIKAYGRKRYPDFKHNPASSVVNAYTGSHPAETVKLVVNINDFDKAIEILGNSPYKDLIE